MKPIAIEIATKTDDGIVRKGHNEDNFAVIASGWGHAMNRIVQTDRGSLLMVADGMGGTNAGEVASQIAVKSVESSMQQLSRLPNSDKSIEAFLVNALEMAHTHIVQHAHANPESAGMGTTAVLVWLLNSKAHIAWCGDSRCYIYRKGIAFRPRTEDHSLVWQEIVGDDFSPEKAEVARLHPDSNIILQGLGEESQPPKPSSKTVELQTADRLIVCSDGLNSMISDRDISAIVSRLDFSPKQICDQLIIAANAAGGSDNITVITADFDVNNPQIVGKTSVNEFQETSAATNTKPMRNILFGVLGSLLIGVGAWFLFFRTQNPMPVDLAKQGKNTADSTIQAVNQSPRTNESSGLPKELAVQNNSNNKTDGKKKDGKSTSVAAENKPTEAPFTDEKLVSRLSQLRAKRSNIGEFLLKFVEEGLMPKEKEKLAELRIDGTKIFDTMHREGLLVKNNDVNKSFNNEPVLTKLEAQLTDFEKRVREWCGDTTNNNCDF